MSYPYQSAPSEKLAPGLKWSLIGHSALFFFVLIKVLIFPSRVVPYIPTLKVDLVALPDVLKKDLANPTRTQFNKEISQLLKQAEQKPASKTVSKTETKTSRKEAPKAEPKVAKDEMLLHSKPQHNKTIEKRNLRALERIKALSKIQLTQEKESEKTQLHPIKGNKLSPGTSLSGEAKEALEASYYDTVRDRLKENWTLPPWIARQDFAAQVQILIDSHGGLREFSFKKSSGNSQFDDAVKRAIQESQPFPTPPKDLASSLLSDGILVGFPL